MPSNAQFEEILGLKEKTMVSFTAKWDISSRRSKPVFEKLARERNFPAIHNFLSVDVDQDVAISKKYNPKPFPVWHIYQEGVKVDELVLSL